jgi:hypothetical protein
MLSLRTLAIVITGVGTFAGVPLTDARACDDDRYPCPVRSEALTQETSDAPTQPAPSAQPQKKSAPRADEPLKGERRDERLVTTAGTAWPVLPNTEGAGVSVPGATGGEPTEAADTNAVQLVDPDKINDLDRAAAAVSAESSWSTYLLLILGAALAAASALWFFAKMIPVYSRRAAGPRMHMRSEW